MSRQAEILLQSIVGRTDAYAVQQHDGSYLAARKPLTLGLLEEHVAGRKTLGSYIVTTGGEARCGVYDFDENSERVRGYLAWLRRWFQHWEIELGIETSGRRGYHGWVMTKQWVQASKLVRLLRLAMRQAEEEVDMTISVEIFPRQAVAQDLGNAIKLPWGIHRGSGNRTAFLDEAFRVFPDWGVNFVECLRSVDEAGIDEILAEYPDREGQDVVEKVRLGRSVYEVVGMLRRPLAVGGRRPALIGLAGYLRYRGIPEEVAVALLLPWAGKAFMDPLPIEEIERHVRGIYQRYGTAAHGRTHRITQPFRLEVPL